jgi:Ca2+-binding RTX toxin-like protein
LDFSGGEYSVNIWARTATPGVTEVWRQAITKGDLPPGGDMTFELLIGDGRPPLSGGENNPGYLVWDNGTGVVIAGLTSGDVNARDGDWHMWTATFTNGRQEIYYDGCLFGSDDYRGPLPLVDEPVIIGGFEGFGPYHHPWVGDLDEVSIYTRTLDTAEIVELYELHRVFTCGAPLCNGQPATIFGDDASEILSGTSGNDVIAGLGGNDAIRGLGGNDLICGGPGDDMIEGGGGRDVILGQSGNDILDGGPSGDQLIGDRGDDTLLGRSGPDELYGGSGDDTMDGGTDTDFCVGASHVLGDTAANCEAVQSVP